MLYSCTKSAIAKAVVFSAVLYAVFLTVLAVYLGVLRGWLILAACGFAVTLCFRFYTRRVFGGITGDLAGFFLSMYELILVIAAALIS